MKPLPLGGLPLRVNQSQTTKLTRTPIPPPGYSGSSSNSVNRPVILLPPRRTRRSLFILRYVCFGPQLLAHLLRISGDIFPSVFRRSLCNADAPAVSYHQLKRGRTHSAPRDRSSGKPLAWPLQFFGVPLDRQ